MSIRWIETEVNFRTPEEIEALRLAVSGHPEHPQRRELELLEQQLGGATTEARFELFAEAQLGIERWRFNRELGNNFLDIVYTPTQSWSLSKDNALIFDPTAVAAGTDPRQTPQLNRNIFTSQVGVLFSGGADTVVTGKLIPELPTVDGDRWRIECVRKYPTGKGLRFEYKGYWSQEHNRGFVETVLILESSPASIGYLDRFFDWIYDRTLKRWVASRVTTSKPNGALWKTLKFDGAHPLPTGGFEAIIAPPRVGGVDAVRGALISMDIIDLGRSVGTRVAADGSQQPLTVVPDEPTAQSGSSFQIVGWAIFGLLGAFVLFIQFRKHSAK